MIKKNLGRTHEAAVVKHTTAEITVINLIN